MTKAHKKWRKNNLATHNFHSSLYRSRLRKALPDMLSEEHLEEIKQFYIDAEYLTALTGELIEVDHIMPLKHDLFCGLHVPWNLQLLTKFENCSKHNRI